MFWQADGGMCENKQHLPIAHYRVAKVLPLIYGINYFYPYPFRRQILRSVHNVSGSLSDL